MRSVLPGLFLTTLLSACAPQSQVEGLQAQLDECSADLEDRGRQVEKAKSIERKTSRELKEALARLAEAEKVVQEVRLAELYAELGAPVGAELGAVFRTSEGDIHCELWPEVAPETVSNFVGLSRGTREWTDPETEKKRTDPLYSGTIFHRVIEGFMIQGGDPLGTGRGGPGYRFGDEVSEDVVFDQDGLLAMANAGPGTNGSQFFITDEGSKPRHLDGKHTIFGKCKEIDVVHTIATKPKVRDRPVEPVVLRQVDITVN